MSGGGTRRGVAALVGLLAVACKGSSGDGEPCSPVDASLPDTGPHEPIGPASVLEEHLHPSRDGAYIDARLTRAASAAMHVDRSFHGNYDGLAYAEPLFVDGLRPGVDALFVASWTNHVTALEARSGAVLWDRTLGTVVKPSSLACAQPESQYYGILATPIIDSATRTLYVESFAQECGNHFVYALSIDDGSTRPGWPVDVGSVLHGFTSGLQHARAGLVLLGGTVYVAFSGILFDCQDYNGWVVGIDTKNPTDVSSWSTSADQAGIWGGLTTDGTSLFFSTGNGLLRGESWGGQESVIRLPRSLAFSGKPVDFFSPSNWAYLDENDFDLGSASVVLFDLPGAVPSTLVAALGKGGVLHLLDRTNLGGFGKGDGANGEGLYSARVSATLDGVKGRLTSYVTAKGRYLVARTTGVGVGCPKPGKYDLVATRIHPTTPPSFSVAWCAHSQGSGSPISTTTDGSSNAIVWVVSAQGTNRLYGFDGDTGEIVYDGGGARDALPIVWRFSSPIVAKGRVFVAGEGQVLAFTEGGG